MISRILDILIYFRIRHSFAHLRPVILSADWSISRLQSWTRSGLPAVAEFVKLTQSIVIEIQRQSADLYKVQLCNRQFSVVSTAIYVVKVYECHPLDDIYTRCAVCWIWSSIGLYNQQQRGSDTQDGATTWHFHYFSELFKRRLRQFQWKINNF